MPDLDGLPRDKRNALIVALERICRTRPYEMRCSAAALAWAANPDAIPDDVIAAANEIVSVVEDPLRPRPIWLRAD